MCISIPETLLHVTLKRRAEISADIFARLLRYFFLSYKNLTIIKISVNDTQGRMLFPQGGVGLKITQLKLALTQYSKDNAIFQRKSKTENHPAKNKVNGAQGTMLFSQERESLKITQ